MAETVYTIPINESFDHYDGCPLCRLRVALEESTLNYSLGAAMMEPDVRIEMNKQGFCNQHLERMAGMKNRLALALILESHLGETITLSEVPPSGGKRSFFGGKSTETDACESFSNIALSCFVCAKIMSTEKRYFSNTVHLWKSDKGFKKKLSEQPYFCVSHISGLMRYAKNDLKPEVYVEFYAVLQSIVKKHYSSILNDVSKFCKSFDHRNAGVALGDERYCIENAMKILK